MRCACQKRMMCTETRATDGQGMRRRYKCECGQRLTTLEIVAEDARAARAALARDRGNAVFQQIKALCEDAMSNIEGLS